MGARHAKRQAGQTGVGGFHGVRCQSVASTLLKITNSNPPYQRR